MHVEITDCWDKWLNGFAEEKKDIYFREAYVKRYSSDGATPLCIICREKDKTLIMPFLRKSIGDFYDFETAYGYGGPISNTDDNGWIRDALNETAEHFTSNRYLCGFIRFHPFLHNAELCAESMKVLFDRNTVYIDTEKTEEQIWMGQISSKNRNMIRKAEKNGLVYSTEWEFESLDEFVCLYNNTMRRLNAESFYYFDNEYYKGMASECHNQMFLGTVRKDGRMICGALFLLDGIYGHYHLEGSDHDFSALGANNLLLWCAAKEMHKRGVKKFHLGGGYDQSLDNSLLKFKKAFSPYQEKFYIGKWIFNQNEYDRICSQWEKDNPDKIQAFGNRLLKYRY